MNLKVGIIQSELHWENVDKNLQMFAQKIEAIHQPIDVIVLPEMFNTGFTMDSKEFAETMKGKTVSWMKKQAIKLDSVVTGSLIIEEQDNYFNRLIWAQPDGEIYTYDKHHLFRMAGEHNHFKAGEERLIVTYKGWRICPLICYDLRFPVWSRNTFLNLAERSRCVVKGEDKSVYDLLIYVANWPQVRKQAWSKLLEARAIENQCFVVGVNRVGEDGNGKGYSGNSVVVAPRGEVISNIIDNTDITESIELSMEELTDVRKKFPVSLDGDEFIL